MISDKELFLEAIQARELSYCPYSGYAVGAALLADDGRVFRGCNIENSAYGPTVCAERCAIFTAVSQGCRSFAAIAIAGGPASELFGSADPAYPCGVCRQVMSEFCRPDRFRILVGRDPGHLESYLLEELLPHGFSL